MHPQRHNHRSRAVTVALLCASGAFFMNVPAVAQAMPEFPTSSALTAATSTVPGIAFHHGTGIASPRKTATTSDWTVRDDSGTLADSERVADAFRSVQPDGIHLKLALVDSTSGTQVATAGKKYASTHKLGRSDLLFFVAVSDRTYSIIFGSDVRLNGSAQEQIDQLIQSHLREAAQSGNWDDALVTVPSSIADAVSGTSAPPAANAPVPDDTDTDPHEDLRAWSWLGGIAFFGFIGIGIALGAYSLLRGRNTKRGDVVGSKPMKPCAPPEAPG